MSESPFDQESKIRLFLTQGLQISSCPAKMAALALRKKEGHGADAVAEGEAKPGSTSANEASDKGSVKPPALRGLPLRAAKAQTAPTWSSSRALRSLSCSRSSSTSSTST